MTERLQVLTSDILDGGYYAALPSVGSSMFPVLRSGDRVYIESLNGNRPEIGDIILFKSGDNMICHRLVRIFENDVVTHYRTRGDAFLHKDESLTYGQIIGRVIRIERNYISCPRRILLLLSPITGRVPLLNAVIVTTLNWIKKIAR